MIDGCSYPIEQQKVFILPPQSSVKLRIDPGSQADYDYVRFHAVQILDQQHVQLAELQCPNEITTPYVHFLIDRMDEVARKRHSGDHWDAMQANLLFQEIIFGLFKDATDEQQRPDVDQAIQLTLDYMEQNYRLPITREKLAGMAGMSADYFSRVFKKKLGQTPMEYLTEVRIRQAKQLLLQSHDSFRSIAQRVGYSDEFYFSRKFKAATGDSPKAYVKKFTYSHRVASLKHLPTGHLIALGIEPYAAVINHVYPITTQLQKTIAVGDFQPDLEKLMRAKPDLIVTSQCTPSAKEKLLDHIAPTVRLPFFQDWRIHLQTIAKIIGKEREAKIWLERYEQKAEMIRKQIKRKIGDDTVLVVGIGEGKMCVYGQRNLGAVLYGDLQLGVPRGVETIAHYKEVALEDLFAYEADRILLTSYKHDGTRRMDEAIQREVSALMANSQWHGLKAVRNGAVSYMHDSQHLYTCYTSFSHDLLLDKMYQLFVSDLPK
ncbi:AraC family transcriptional regulator [Brevibacillus humidisoli]|uniref:helix-turn-helix domain-containing protein n=1 Tax=Brevibacillus humidisoli TaxID=2895522 RepID=UPI001E5F9DCF|nr:helix-turn-helix domain-containing protein [Brevibacillus humidisoli]UFJ39448.1 AraC family transcriptional regulator [Brevibacillus humidisoli]